MGSQVVTRPQNSPLYQANSKQSVPIDRGDVLRNLTVSIASQPTLTSGNNTVALAQPGDYLASLSRVTLRANGSDVLYDLPGQACYWMNRILSKNGHGAAFVPALGDGATANPAGVETFDIGFQNELNSNPADTWLWTQPLTSLQLELQWAANWTAINSSASAFTANPAITLGGEFGSLGQKQSINPQTRAPLWNADGTPMMESYYPPVGQRIITVAPTAFAGATTGGRINLDSGKFSYRGLLIQATTTATPAVDTAGLITNFQLINGSTYYRNDPEAIVRRQTDRRLGLYQYKVATTGIGYQGSPRISGSSSPLGWYFLDLAPDGYLSECVPTNATEQLFLNLAISGACTVNVYAIQMLDLVNGNPIR